MRAAFLGRALLAALLATLAFGVPLTGATPIDIPIIISGPGSGPPPPGCTLSLRPIAATIPASAPSGTAVSAIIATSCSAAPTFGPPNFDDGGLFAISGGNVVISQQGPGVGSLAGTTQHATITVAGAPSADLSVQVGPAGSIACDIGPPYTGAIPAGAVAAGFTHCAANYDFSAPFYAVRSNWLDCAGAASPQWWNLPYAGGAAVPCGRYNVIADPAFGTNALQSIFQPSDWPASTSTEIDSTNSGSPTFGASPGFFFASTFYVDVVEYVTSNTQNNAYAGTSCGVSPALMGGVWTWAAPQTVETDFMEFYPGLNKCTNGGNTHDWGDGNIQLAPGNEGGQPGQQGGYDPTIPHTYGTLQTASGATFTRCNYMDGTRLGSSCDSNTFSPAALNTHSFLKITFGPESNAGGTQPLVNEDLRVQRITVWECTDYQDGPC